MTKFLIIGLGNIGSEYELTRHNIGFMAVDQLAADHHVSFELKRLAYQTEFSYKGKKIYLIKPTTYMNLSGKAMLYWMKELHIGVENTLVIVDDLALPFGKLRLRPKGSSGGHNGLKSIEASLGHASYPRLKFGIGDNFYPGKQVEYVLSNFSKEEKNELPSLLTTCESVIINFCLLGIEKTMNLPTNR